MTISKVLCGLALFSLEGTALACDPMTQIAKVQLGSLLPFQPIVQNYEQDIISIVNICTDPARGTSVTVTAVRTKAAIGKLHGNCSIFVGYLISVQLDDPTAGFATVHYCLENSFIDPKVKFTDNARRLTIRR